MTKDHLPHSISKPYRSGHSSAGISSSTGIGMHGRLGLPGGQEPCSNLAEHHMSLPSIDSHKPGHQTFYLLTSSQSVSPTCSAEQTKEAKGNNGLSESLFAAIRLGSTNNRISYFPQAPPIDLESMEQDNGARQPHAANPGKDGPAPPSGNSDKKFKNRLRDTLGIKKKGKTGHRRRPHAAKTSTGILTSNPNLFFPEKSDNSTADMPQACFLVGGRRPPIAATGSATGESVEVRGRRVQLDPLVTSSNGITGMAQRIFGYPLSPQLPPPIPSADVPDSSEGRQGNMVLKRTSSAPPSSFDAMCREAEQREMMQSESSDSSESDKKTSPTPSLRSPNTKPPPPSPADKARGMFGGLLMPLRRSPAVTADGEGDNTYQSDGEEALASAMISNASSPMQYKMVPYKTLSGLDPTLCFGLQRSNQRLLALNDGLEDEVMEGDGDAEAVRLKVQRTPLPQWDGIVVPSAVGLKNLGNTCFINTALQCLLHTPHLLPAVLPREEMEELEAVLKARKERQQTEAASAVMSAKSLAIGLRSLGLGKSTVKEKKTIQSGANSLPGITACDSKSHLAAQHEGEGSSHGADGEDSQQSPPDESRNTTEADVQEAQGEQLDEDVVSQVLAEDSIGPEITGVTGDDGGDSSCADFEGDVGMNEQVSDCILEDTTESEVNGDPRRSHFSSADTGSRDDATVDEGKIQGGNAEGAEGETSTGAAGGEKQQGAAAEPQEMAEAASVSGATARGEAEGTSATALPPPKPGFIKGSMAAEFNSILKALTLAETKSIDPTELFEVIKTHPFGAELCDGGQHDCQEIMRVLMDSLHEDLNRAEKLDRSELPDPDEKGITEFEKAERCWRHYLNFDSSPITDLYGGQLQSSVTCHGCNNCITTYEPFWDISLPISKDAIAKKGGLGAWFASGDLTLEDCLRAFTADETLAGDEGYMCETCKEVTTATKRMRIHRFPNTLIIHLKRFKCTATSREKISNAIGFPVTDLKLHELATPESAHRKGDATYDLVGLCNHTGSMQGGHYTSACKVMDLECGVAAWHTFNDMNVAKLQSSSIVTSNAYILFYALRPEDYKGSKGKRKDKDRKKDQNPKE